MLDTNVLLLPYTTGSKSLQEISARYRALAQEGRLVVPGQVAREFAKLRATKLAELRQQLADRKSKIVAPQSGKYPLLESTKEFQRVEELEAQLKDLVRQYQDAMQGVINLIGTWGWQDPVTVLYEGLFSGHVVVDPKVNREETRKDLNRRLANKIPPGFKDAGKDDLGIGDLLIWKTILELGASRQVGVIFVSNDGKADWWHLSGDVTLLPRHELVEEFRQASGGQSFHMLRLSQFLDVFEAEQSVVAEVRQRESEQVQLQILRNVERHLDPGEARRITVADHALERGLSNELMELGWYIGTMHRRADGVSIRLRDHTADYPGMKERWFSGKDRLEALQRAVSELVAEDWDDLPEE